MGLVLTAVYRMLTGLLAWPAGVVLSRNPNFRGTILNRLGLVLPDIPAHLPLIWIHASSMGEVRAVTGLVKALRREKPHVIICLSTMTATGRQIASSIPELDVVFPFPFDAPWIMRRYLSALSPRMLIIVETEIWPNMIIEARDRGIPTIIVNARMTERSFRRYSMLSPLAGEILHDVHILAISENDGNRFSRLGAGDVRAVGNLKLDSIQDVDPARPQEVKAGLGAGQRPVFIAGSIREGEEGMVFSALAKAASNVPGLFSILAPRHPEQIPLLKDLAERGSYRWCLKSEMKSDTDLVIVNTMGELFDLYGASDTAFVGGSLVDLGGQNILEPLAWGVPTIHGPHMENFTWALDVVGGYTVPVGRAEELADAVIETLTQPGKYRDMAQEARRLLEKHKGVTERCLAVLLEYLP
ncbi:MAG: 3-deoxy-D-manno-octulosonic acid transferase [Desulfomonilia bacterium]|nr:3-deoxy-D-manno-octulosonic acid transferase [Pseudomonadota bacterium]